MVLWLRGPRDQAMEKLSAFTTDQLADLFIVSDVEIAGAAGRRRGPRDPGRGVRGQGREV